MSLKARAAKHLRALADKLDPQKAAEKRHHPALKNPGELKDVAAEPSPAGAVAQKPGGHVSWAVVPGRWGGPYI